MSDRRGVTLLEVLIVGCVLFVLIGVMLPGFQRAREASRKTTCRDRLRVIGYGLHNYHDAHRVFPPGALSWPQFPETQVAAVCAMFHFYESASLRYYFGRHSWKDEEAEFASMTIPLFVCPSNTSAKVTRDPFLGKLGRRVGDTFGVLSYVYCKGPGDAFCSSPEAIPAHERGAFDVDFWCKVRDVTDGLSHTIFVGEGATGSPWEICGEVGCTQPVRNPATGRWLRHQPFVAPHINTDRTIAEAGLRASQFGSTMEPMNKNPVTDTMIDSSALNDCRSSTDGGPHRTSNFRSSHADGAFFLFGDGSVNFLDEEIDMSLYRGLSTIAGAERIPMLEWARQ